MVRTAAIGVWEKRLDQMEINKQNMADKILHVPISLAPILANNDALKKKINQIRNDMESMIERILQTFARLNAAASL